MKIVTLVENEAEVSGLKAAHGLSLYIEHEDKKILFDIGPGKQYIKNAKELGIDLSEVDICIISHGHFDHGKNIDTFFKVNEKANVYIAKSAFEKKFKSVKGIYLPIGIKKPKDMERIIEIEEDIKIDNGIKIFFDVPLVEQVITDDSLLQKTKDGYVQDDFDHEIYLVLYNRNSKVLFTGCSHKGIENIIDSIEEKEKRPFTAVVGGYHFSHFDSQDIRQFMYLEQLSDKLSKKGDVTYLTGHCTGDEAFMHMRNVLKNKIQRIKAGSVFEI